MKNASMLFMLVLLAHCFCLPANGHYDLIMHNFELNYSLIDRHANVSCSNSQMQRFHLEGDTLVRRRWHDQAKQLQKSVTYFYRNKDGIFQIDYTSFFINGKREQQLSYQDINSIVLSNVNDSASAISMNAPNTEAVAFTNDPLAQVRFLSYKGSPTLEPSQLRDFQFHQVGWQFEWFESGALKEKVRYDIKRKGKWGYVVTNGTMQEFYPNGRLRLSYSYVDGNKTGAQREFYSNGQLSVGAHYDSNHKLTDTLVRYNENGTIRGYQVFSPRNAKEISSVTRSYYSNGTLNVQVSHLRGGLRLVNRYTENGKVLRRDSLHGKNLVISSRYDTTGVLVAQTHISKKRTRTTHFYSNGKTKELRCYKTAYFFRNPLYSEDPFKFDKWLMGTLTVRDASWQICFPNGKNKEVKKYRRGRLKKTITWDTAGEKQSTVKSNDKKFYHKKAEPKFSL